MIRKTILFFAFCLFLLALVDLGAGFQEETYCSPGSECSFVFQVRNFYNPGEVYTGLECSIDFYHPNSTLWKKDKMSSQSNGFYNYTLKTQENGTYYWSAECKNASTGEVKSAKSGIVHVEESVRGKLDSIENNTETLKQKSSEIIEKIENRTKLTITDFTEVQEGEMYRTKVKAYGFQGKLKKLDSAPEITIYDPERNKIIEDVSATTVSRGVYEYSYNTSSGMTGGVYETVANVSDPGLTLSDYWELESSPAQVKINKITDEETPSIAADVTITNEGNSDYEYQYEYCAVKKETNRCGGGDDLDYASGAKLIKQGESWNPKLKLDEVETEGDLWFKLVVYYDTEKSGASHTFTTSRSSGDTSPESGSGDFTLSDSISDKNSEIAIVRAENPSLLKGKAEKAEVTVENTGATAQNISLGIEGLLFKWYEIDKSGEKYLQPGERTTFTVRFQPPQGIDRGNYSFTYIAKGGNIKDKKDSSLSVFESRKKLLQAEIEELRRENNKLQRSVEKLKEKNPYLNERIYGLALLLLLGFLVVFTLVLNHRDRKKINNLEELFYSEITSQTVSEAREEIDELDGPDYQKLLEEEKETKDRKIMKHYIREKMNEDEDQDQDS